MNDTTLNYQESFERQADVGDIATSLELADTARQVRAAQAAQASLKLDPEFDGIHCVECGEVIPDGRIKALSFHVQVAGEFKISMHKTDKPCVEKGVSHVLKHGTDKCIHCQSALATAKKQYA